MALIGSSNEQKIWNFLTTALNNEYGAAGLMGNLNAESNCEPANLEDTYSRKLGLSDSEYTKRVDNGTYANFVNDSAGYGLAQWTWWTRKQSLLAYAKSKNKSIGDLEMQLEFLMKELREIFPSVLKTLQNTKSVLEASNSVLINFENPLDSGPAVQSRRAGYGQNYYNKFHGGGTVTMATGLHAKGQNVKLSEHFGSTEFDCHGVGCCSQTKVNP